MLIAGLDAAYDSEEAAGASRCWSAAVLWDTQAGAAVGQAIAESLVIFPYVPGRLAPRELPGLLQALRGLARKPDLLLCDAHGRAHPLRFGLACSLGEAAGLPAIGCAKSRLVGEYEEPGESQGSAAALRDHGERIGTVLRTQSGTRPVFISVGWGLELPEAERTVMACVTSHRIPEPLRLAHILARQAAQAARES